MSTRCFAMVAATWLAIGLAACSDDETTPIEDTSQVADGTIDLTSDTTAADSTASTDTVTDTEERDPVDAARDTSSSLDADAQPDADAQVDADDAADTVWDGTCTGPWPTAWAALEDEALSVLNTTRAAGATCGTTAFDPAPAMTMDAPLREVARCHAADMALNNFIGHQGSDGVSLFDKAAAASSGSVASADLGSGMADATAAIQQLMSDETICANIMDPTTTVAGIGYVKDDAFNFTHAWVKIQVRP